VRILVTGATGYLGAEVVRALLENELFTVIALGRDLEKFERLSHWCGEGSARLQPLIADVCSLENFPSGIEAVVHAAALRAIQGDEDHRAATVQVNIAGTSNLLRLAARHELRRFVFISSQSVYGRCPSPWDESMQPDPQGVYAETKYAGEQLVSSFEDALDFVVLRLSRLYGVSFAMRWGEIAGKFSQLVCEGQSVPIYGNGTQRFDLLHVRDAAQAVTLLLRAHPKGWNSVYNIGSGGSVSINELVTLFSELAVELGLPTVVVERHPELGTNPPPHLELDITRVRTELGWQPHWTLRDGLREYLNAYSRVGGSSTKTQM